MPDLSNLHFLRPMWFWALVPGILLWILMLREEGRSRRWQSAIAPHLLKHLIRRPGRRSWIRPAYVALPFILIGILSLAGPAWKRQKNPFVQDATALVVALDLSSSMDAVDVQPSRLALARRKIRDLMALRSGGRTGKDDFMKDAEGRRVISRLDRKGLETLEAQAKVYVVGATLDDLDVRKLVHRANIHLKTAQAFDERIPWEDEGYYLVFSALLLALVWFRKGWTIRWQ